MWEIIATITIALSPSETPHYVSCPSGYVVENIADCPVIPKHNHYNPDAPIGGGPRGRGGLLGLGIGGIL